ncbi:hypothetical protein BC938DRAFT_483978, partial [Jimgerdemannia flammicorona]
MVDTNQSGASSSQSPPSSSSSSSSSSTPAFSSTASSGGRIDFVEIFNDTPLFHEALTEKERAFERFSGWIDAVQGCCRLGDAFSKSLQRIMTDFMEIIEFGGENSVQQKDKAPSSSSATWNLGSRIIEILGELDNVRATLLSRVQASVIDSLEEHRRQLDEKVKSTRDKLERTREEHEANVLRHCGHSRRRDTITGLNAFEKNAQAVFTTKQLLCSTSFEYLTLLTEVLKVMRSVACEK